MSAYVCACVRAGTHVVRIGIQPSAGISIFGAPTELRGAIKFFCPLLRNYFTNFVMDGFSGTRLAADTPQLIWSPAVISKVPPKLTANDLDS